VGGGGGGGLVGGGGWGGLVWGLVWLGFFDVLPAPENGRAHQVQKKKKRSVPPLTVEGGSGGSEAQTSRVRDPVAKTDPYSLRFVACAKKPKQGALLN